MQGKDYWILLYSEQIGLTGGKMETRVTLRPGEKGTKALVKSADCGWCVSAIDTMPLPACATRPWN